jgi:hypothetical protein
MVFQRHCEERSDEAIQTFRRLEEELDCFVGLRPPRNDDAMFSSGAIAARGLPPACRDGSASFRHFAGDPTFILSEADREIWDCAPTLT